MRRAQTPARRDAGIRAGRFFLISAARRLGHREELTAPYAQLRRKNSMYCATRSPRVTCTLKILGLPGPCSSTSWTPASTLKRQRRDAVWLPVDQTSTPCGFDSMTRVPVFENSHSGAGMNCAAVNALIIVMSSSRYPQILLEPCDSQVSVVPQTRCPAS